MPLSHTALTVRCVGIESTSVKFQPMVIMLFCAILKYDVAVCGGWVMVRLPAGADWGMLKVEEDEEDGGAVEFDGVVPLLGAVELPGAPATVGAVPPGPDAPGCPCP